MSKTAARGWTGLALSAALAWVVPARAQPAFGPVQERHLDNGLTVLVQEDHNVPFVALTLRYDGGDHAVPPDVDAVGSLAGQLMERATKHVGPGEYPLLLARAGAWGVARRTTGATTVLEATVPANQVALPLWLWSDQMGAFDAPLDDAQLEALRARVREQQRASLEGSPLGRLDQYANEELYPPGHPYRDAFFAPQSVDRVDRAAVAAFHATWLTPGHATLAIVGDVAAADAFALVSRYFGPVAKGTGNEGAPLPPVRLSAERRVQIAANVARAHVSIRWPTPKLYTAEDARLDVVAQLFAGQRTLWLYWKLVDDAKVATHVSARQRSGALGSEFDVEIDAAAGKSGSDVLAAFDGAMDETRSRFAGNHEIDGAVYEVLVNRQMSIERSSVRASEYAKSSACVGVADNLGSDFGRYAGITSAIVRSTILQFLPRDRRVVLLVTPTPTAAAGGERVGRTP